MKTQNNIVNFEFPDVEVTLTEAITESFHLFLKRTFSSYPINIGHSFSEDSHAHRND